jgi:hypothetical protein
MLLLSVVNVFWMWHGIKVAMKKAEMQNGLGKITMPLGFVV